MGWFGLNRHVLHVLSTLGADRDEEGKYILGGTVVAGIGGGEIVLGDDAVYFVNGEQRSLTSAMNGTSYGVRGIGVF